MKEFVDGDTVVRLLDVCKCDVYVFTLTLIAFSEAGQEFHFFEIGAVPSESSLCIRYELFFLYPVRQSLAALGYRCLFGDTGCGS